MPDSKLNPSAGTGGRPNQDVAGDKQAQEGVQAERQRLNDVLNMLPAYVILLSPSYHVPFANRFFEERFGKSEGRRCYEYLFNRTAPCETCETFKVLKTNAPHRWEWTGPDGRHYDIHDFPFTDVDGSPLIMEVGLDITERKKADAEVAKHREHLRELVKERTGQLEATNEQLRAEIIERKQAEERLCKERDFTAAVLDTAGALIVVLDKEGRITRFNRACEALTGYTAAEVLGRAIWEFLIPPEELPGVRQVWEALQAGDFPNQHENHWVARDGSRRLIAWSNTAIVTPEGRIASIIGTGLDITQRKQTEAEVQRHAEELRTTNEELTRFNKAMVGRELRMVELKQEVNALCAQVGQPPRYGPELDQEARSTP